MIQPGYYFVFFPKSGSTKPAVYHQSNRREHFARGASERLPRGFPNTRTVLVQAMDAGFILADLHNVCGGRSVF